MSLLPPRRVTAIDAELHALRDVIRGAMGELMEVRRRQAELVDMEAALVVSIDVRMRRLDDLLDQRLHVVRAVGRPDSGRPTGEDAAEGVDGPPYGCSGPVSATR